jgi:hypothetical protein
MLHLAHQEGHHAVSLPTKDDFNAYGSPEETTACKHFYNKTLPEAEALFHENGLTYGQDFMWMGAKAFNYYLDAFINYLRSDDSAGDSDVINCLPSVIEYRWNDEEFPMALPRVRGMVDYVIKNYGKFEVDSTIYGDLLATYKALQNKLDEERGDNQSG